MNLALTTISLRQVLSDFLHSRRSIRRFLNQDISQDILQHILETATWAPSSHNRQPWRFAVLASREARLAMANEMGEDFYNDLVAEGLSAEAATLQVERSRRRILEAPAAILICLDPTAGDNYPDEARQKAEYLMGVQSVALAGGTLLLAAHAEGLGGVWMCAPLFTPATVRRVLDLPASWDPQGLLLLGFPAESPAARPRRPVHEVALFL